MNIFREENSTKVLNYFVGIIAFLSLGYIVYIGAGVLIPLSLAVFLAYLSDPIYEFLSVKYKVPSVISILIIVSLLIAVLIGIQNILISSLRDFPVSNYYSLFIDQVRTLLYLAESYQIDINSSQGIEQLINQGYIQKIVGFSFDTVRGLATSIFFTLLFTVFILLERNSFSQKIETLSQKYGMRSNVKNVLRNINKQVEHYIVWKTTISLLTGFTSYVVFIFFGLDSPFLWAFLIFIFNYIPTLGSIIASIFPVLIALIQFQSVGAMFVMLVCMVIIQVTYGNIIEPRLMGNKLNLSPLVVLISLLVWNKLWGVSGMFLAIPIMATLNIILANIPATSHISLLISNRPQRKYFKDGRFFKEVSRDNS